MENGELEPKKKQKINYLFCNLFSLFFFFPLGLARKVIQKRADDRLRPHRERRQISAALPGDSHDDKPFLADLLQTRGLVRWLADHGARRPCTKPQQRHACNANTQTQRPGNGRKPVVTLYYFVQLSFISRGVADDDVHSRTHCSNAASHHHQP